MGSFPRAGLLGMSNLQQPARAQSDLVGREGKSAR